jgi:PHP family Zn ribbon phosphoesterase
MTPNNILNMAMLKKLDFVAITDHNTTKQLKVFSELEDSYDFVFIPGVEVTVKENFVVLCFFKSFNNALKFDKLLEKNLDGEWGVFTPKDQILTDIYDTEVGNFHKPLTSTSIPYKELFKEVRKLNGLLILCHIDRSSHSAFNIVDFNDIEFDAIEISKYSKDTFLKKYPELKKYKIIFNSDSHTLLSISEREYTLDLKNKSLESFFDYFRGEDNE